MRISTLLLGVALLSVPYVAAAAEELPIGPDAAKLIKGKPCLALKVGVMLQWPETKLAPERVACANDPDQFNCRVAKETLSEDQAKKLTCRAADKAERKREAPYTMSPDEVRRVQTILIECHQADLGLPDGVFGKKTKAAIDSLTSGFVFNKERFDELAKGCPDEQRLYAAASMASDGFFHTVSKFTSGVAALQATLDACNRQSKAPDTCSGMVATRFPLHGDAYDFFIKEGTAIAVARCNNGKDLWTFMNRGRGKEGALAYTSEAISRKGFSMPDCAIEVVEPTASK